MTDTDATSTRGQRFVEALINLCRQDNAIGASFRRAASPALGYQCWMSLVRLGVDIEKESERAVFTCVGSAIAKGRVERNGTLSLCRALANCYPPGSPQPEAKLRRLLGCTDVSDCCAVLRPIIRLIQSRVPQPFDYAGLADDLLRFRSNPDRIRAKWAADFLRGEK